MVSHSHFVSAVSMGPSGCYDFSFSIGFDNSNHLGWVNCNYQQVFSDSTIPVGEWHHIAVTYEFGLLQFYIVRITCHIY